MKDKRHTKLGVAIIGCGEMGLAHAAAWGERDDAQVVAVYDADGSRAQTLAQETNVRMADSWQSAVKTDGVDIVSICTPVSHHAEIAVFAAQAGRHILCEKAIALTLQDADAMIEAANKNGIKLVISYQHRTYPHHRKLRELIQEGVLGSPLLVRFEDVRGVRPKTAMHSRSGNGGPIIDMGGHFFDLIRYYTGADPVSLTAFGHIFGQGKPVLKNVKDLAIDAAEILVSYTSGHILSISINWGLPEGHPERTDVTVSGPEASASVAGDRVLVRYHDREVLYDTGPALTGPAGRIADLIDSVKHDVRPEVAGEDGRMALEVCLAALKSIETGVSVSLGAQQGVIS